MKNFSFDKFSRLEFFKKVNKEFLYSVDIERKEKILDLGCGTGGITEIILEKIRNTKNHIIYAVDTSKEALKQAQNNLKKFREASIHFIHSKAEDLIEVLNSKVDMVVFCNAIHYIPDKEKLLRDIFKILKKGGLFLFNTSFFKGAHLPETDIFYRRWMIRAIRILKTEYKINFKKEEKVWARKTLPPLEYKEILLKTGFNIKKFDIKRIELPLEGWLAISEFKDFIEGIFPKIPLEKASEALKKAVKKVFQDMKIKTVPRNWLEVVAIKP